MAFDKFKRLLTFFDPSLLVFFYSHHSQMHALVYDKLLRAPTTPKGIGLILNERSG